MKKILDLLEFFLILSLIVLAIWYFFIRDKGPAAVPDMVYKTKIVNIDVPYKVSVPYSVGTKPITIYKYRTDTSALDSLKMVIYQNEILIKGLKEEVKISMDFIKYFAKNPKLVELNLTRDTLAMSLLHIDGNIIQNVYPVFLNNFAYRWTYNRLTHTELPPPIIEESSWIDLYGGGGFDFISLSPYLDFQVEKDWTRIRAYAGLQVGLLNINSSQLKLGIRYKINK